ncbi:tryptophan synthase beta subunit-like PLP-dependent enzyme [Pleurotus eryngii]|uniref:threonine synthase n=1 Tax=Pleurotus eryngii TaxID=5323 RepID=A0A9P6DDM0_PLEER|nr:tryptophan synthase beta subunit-like PLP-dependent enzyme [Pleurotus eryngii]
MRYFSTRGGGDTLSFEEAVLTGLAPNGGLYIPEHIPQLPANWRSEWKSYTFQELSVAVLSLFISSEEISQAELKSLVEKSYSTFRHPDVTPLKQLGSVTYVLELFHGPTYAFKDVALQLLGNLFEFFLLRRNAQKGRGAKPEQLTVVGATSGDTGSAAIHGLRNKANISIFILHPKGRVSPIQEAQMTTVTDANVHNIAVKGTFDDCQDIVKALFADKVFNDAYRLGAVNSINWARILAQTVYYFLAYFHIHSQLPENTDFEIQYVVPTGNFGDILAGYYAKQMGLPMGKLVVATNANDILARFWKSGRYEKIDSTAIVNASDPTTPANGASDGKQTSGGVKETYSPAMDILVSSNFERLLWYLANESAEGSNEKDRRQHACAMVDDWMRKVKQDGRMEVPPAVLAAARRDFVAEKVTDDLTLKTIKSYFEGTPSYIADPHTAIGFAAAQIVAPENSAKTRHIILSTAHPAKFSEAVSRALEQSSQFNFERDVLPEEFRGLSSKEKRIIDVERPEVELVKRVIMQHMDTKNTTPLLQEKGGSI